MYVSLRSGLDSGNCGGFYNPCKTLQQGVKRSDWRDRVLLMGIENSDPQLYTCESTAFGQRGAPTDRVLIDKNLTLAGFIFPTRVSCRGGIVFNRASQQQLHIKLRNLEFLNTTVKVYDSSLEIENCTFSNALKAIDISISGQNIIFVAIVHSVFSRNNGSVVVNVTGGLAQHEVLLNVKNTSFVGNTANGDIAGGITVTSYNDSRTILNIFCEGGQFSFNYGPVISINISNGTTKEKYKRVLIQSNEDPTYNYKNIEGHPNTGSIYFSTSTESFITFESVSCSRNKNIRCFENRSTKMTLSITEGYFLKQNVGDSKVGGVILTRNELLTKLLIKNSSFLYNHAKLGGSIFIGYNKARKLNTGVELYLDNVQFTRCTAWWNGAAVHVGEYISEFAAYYCFPFAFVTASLNHVLVEENSLLSDYKPNKFGHGAVVFDQCVKGVVQITVDYSLWTKNTGRITKLTDYYHLRRFAGASLVMKFSHRRSPKKTDYEESKITIRYSNFTENRSAGTGSAIEIHSFLKLKVLILNSRISYNVNPIGGAVFILGDAQSTITCSNFTGNDHSAILLSGNVLTLLWFTGVGGLLLDACSFVDNKEALTVMAYNAREFTKHIKINNTLFYNKNQSHPGFALRIYGHVRFCELNIFLENVDSFNALFAIHLVEHFRKKDPRFLCGRTMVNVERSTFRHNFSQITSPNTWYLLPYKGTMIYWYSAGPYRLAMFQILVPPNRQNEYSSSFGRYYKSWTYEHNALFQDSTFEGTNNVKTLSGAFYVENANTTFTNCVFRNVLGSTRGGTIYAGDGSARVQISGTLFVQSQSSVISTGSKSNPFSFIYSDSEGELVLLNSTMISDMFTDRHPIISVTRGGKMIMENASIFCTTGSALKFENYSYMARTSTAGVSSIPLVSITSLLFSCEACSVGFYSLQRGHSNDYNIRNFRCLPCPYGASCTRNIVSKPNFWGYNVSEDPPALNFTSCPLDYCNVPATFKTSVYNGCHGNRGGIMCGSCKQGYSETLFSEKCRKSNKCNDHWFWIITTIYLFIMSLYLVHKPPIASYLWNQLTSLIRKPQVRQVLREESEDSGYVKILFYFYQMAQILMLQSYPELFLKVNFIKPLISLFNFQVQAIDKEMGCPFPGLDVVTKELFLSTEVFGTMFFAILIYFCHRLFNIFIKKDQPHFLPYLAATMETLLLGYASLTNTSLKLLTCVPMKSELRLFSCGDIVCFQWWQILLGFFVLFFLLPFVFILYFGSKELYESRISILHFMTACCLPLPVLVYWGFRRLNRNSTQEGERIIQRSTERDMETSAIKEVLYGPFRRPSETTGGTLHWESILIGRRFLLLTVHSFITDPMTRFICLDACSLAIFIHHLIKKPFKDSKANVIESLSLLSLVAIATINVAKASFVSAAVVAEGPVLDRFEVFEWIEIVLLLTAPGVLFMLAFAALVNQIVRFVMFVYAWALRVLRQIKNWKTGHALDLQSPLLGQEIFLEDPDEPL